MGSDSKLHLVMVHAPDPIFTIIADYGNRFMPVWSYTLASSIDKDKYNLEISLYDTRVRGDKDNIYGEIFFYSGINQDLQRILEIRDRLNKLNPGSIHIIGGPITWSYDKAGELGLLNVFDYIFIGDGEEEVERLLDEAVILYNNGKGSNDRDPIIKRAVKRFDMMEAKVMDRELLEANIFNYYGGVIEISRGCPFLCEFCDIRILSDNNKSHNKPVNVIIEELDYFSKKGIKQFILACDNMIGDPRWAEELVDGILKWRLEGGVNVVFYTWVTLTIVRFDRLMKKMREAGFDLLFIGIESFSNNSLLETAKLQNISELGMVESIKTIQSYGFIIVAGMIIGFDSDTEDVFDESISGLEESGILSGDPGMLYALPGTPLYYRMKLAKRLRDISESKGSRQKLRTNIIYLLDSGLLKKGWVRLANKLVDGKFNYNRLLNYMNNLTIGNYIPLNSTGFGNVFLFTKLVLSSKEGRRQMIIRVFGLINIFNFIYLIKGFLLCFNKRKIVPDYFRYFSFWLFSWSSAIVRYKGIKEDDIDIISLNREAVLSDVIPDGYEEIVDEDIEITKSRAQRRSTINSLLNRFK